MDEAKADIRAIPQHSAMNILTAIHSLAEFGTGRVKALKGDSEDKRLRVGDFRVRFTEDTPTPFEFTPSKTEKTSIAESDIGAQR